MDPSHALSYIYGYEVDQSRKCFAGKYGPHPSVAVLAMHTADKQALDECHEGCMSLLLVTAVVRISLLLAGDVELNPGPLRREGKDHASLSDN